MKKIFIVLILSFSIVILSGCSKAETKPIPEIYIDYDDEYRSDNYVILTTETNSIVISDLESRINITQYDGDGGTIEGIEDYELELECSNASLEITGTECEVTITISTGIHKIDSYDKVQLEQQGFEVKDNSLEYKFSIDALIFTDQTEMYRAFILELGFENTVRGEGGKCISLLTMNPETTSNKYYFCIDDQDNIWGIPNIGTENNNTSFAGYLSDFVSGSSIEFSAIYRNGDGGAMDVDADWFPNLEEALVNPKYNTTIYSDSSVKTKMESDISWAMVEWKYILIWIDMEVDAYDGN